MECSIYRGSDSHEDDRCLVPPVHAPPILLWAALRTEDSLQQDSSVTLTRANKSGVYMDLKSATFLVLIFFYILYIISGLC